MFLVWVGLENKMELMMKKNKVNQNLCSKVSAILFRHDIVGINFGENTNEYSIEANSILMRLNNKHNVGDISVIVYEEFLKWFSEDLIPDKKAKVYNIVAKEILDIWEE
jgi:hypothetical protein